MSADAQLTFEAKFIDDISAQLAKIEGNMLKLENTTYSSFDKMQKSVKDSTEKSKKNSDDFFESMQGHIGIVNGHLKTFVNLIPSIGGAFAAIAGVEFLKHQLEQMSEFGEAMEKAEAKTGLSTVALQEWSFAAKTNGTTLEALVPGFKKLAANAEAAHNSHSAMAKTFREAGVDAAKYKGDMTGLSEAVITSLAGMDDKQKQLALTQKLLGRSGMEFLPILSEQAEGLKALKQEAHDLGLILGDDTVKKASELNDQMDRMGLVVTALKYKLATPLLGVVSQSLETTIGIINTISKSWESFDDTVSESSEGLNIFQVGLLGIANTAYTVNASIQGIIADAKILASAGKYLLAKTSGFGSGAWDTFKEESREAADQVRKSNEIMEKSITDLYLKLEKSNQPIDKPKKKTASDQPEPITEDEKAKRANMLKLQEEFETKKIENSENGLKRLLDIEDTHYKYEKLRYIDSQKELDAALNVHTEARKEIIKKYSDDYIDLQTKEADDLVKIADESAKKFSASLKAGHKLDDDIKASNGDNKYDIERDQAQRHFNEMYEAAEEFRKTDVDGEAKYQQRIISLKEAEARKAMQINIAENTAILSASANFFGSMANLITALGGKNKAAAEASARIAEVQALINVAVGVTQAYAQGGVLGFITGAAVAAAGAAQIAVIEANLSKFATGTINAPGGRVLVGERGPELVDIPRGSTIHNNTATQRMMGGGGDVNSNHTIIINGNVTQEILGQIRESQDNYLEELKLLAKKNKDIYDYGVVA